MGAPHTSKVDPRPGRGVCLCLDLGTNAGWCDVDEQGNVRSGYFKFDAKKFPRVGQRYLAFRAALIAYKAKLEADGRRLGAIYYEKVDFAPTQNGLQALQRWAGFQACLLVFGETHKIVPVDVHVAKVKKAATGRGDAPKDAKRKKAINAKRTLTKRKLYDGETVAEALTRRGFVFSSEDEADSIAVMLHALEDEKHG